MNPATQEPAISSSESSEESSAVVHPWEDLATVLRHANRARAAGDLKRACTFYSRAIDLDPNSAQAWAGRASTTANLDEAIISWGYVLALTPDNEARAMLNACVTEKIKEGVDQADPLVKLGRTLAKAGQWPVAHRLFVRATELAPADDEAWVWRAGVSSDSAETIDCLKKALELNPRNARARAGLQWAQSKTGAAPDATPAVEDADSVLEEGRQQLQAGNHTRAYEHFAHATELDSQNASAWFWRGSTAPSIEEALTCMDHVLAINPEDEAAKDARWWLRVQQLRERAPTLLGSPKRPTIDPYAAQYPRRRRSIVPILMLFFLVVLFFGLLSVFLVLNVIR